MSNRTPRLRGPLGRAKTEAENSQAEPVKPVEKRQAGRTNAKKGE